MTTVRFTRALAAAALTIGGLGAASPATAGPRTPQHDHLYVFGDSLADTGNVFLLSRWIGVDPAPPPSESPHKTYFQGRFSNGPVAFEYLWQLLSGNAPGSAGGLVPVSAGPDLSRAAAVNFAFGGTGTPFIDRTPGGLYAPGLKGQVALFGAALRDKPSKRALYAVVTGANDYRSDQFNQPMAPEVVVGNIVDAVTSLYAVGARDVVVLNMPDLGLLPGSGGPGSPASLLSAYHNALLKERLDALAARYKGLHIVHIDINAIFLELRAQMDATTPALDVLFPPELFPPGFTMSVCLFFNPVTCADVPTFDMHGAYLFWDIIHPTTDVHRIVGQRVYDALQP